jgi:hypothetical protein
MVVPSALAPASSERRLNWAIMGFLRARRFR